MRRGLGGLFGAGMLALCACQPRYLPVDQAGRITATPPEPAAAPRPPGETPPTPAVPVEPPQAPSAAPAGASAPPPPDGCGASGLRYLVGKPRTQIPVPVDLSKRRVECVTCSAAPKPDPSRVTIRYDLATGLVTEVICR